MATKKKSIVEMTNMQVLHRMVCGDAPAALIVNSARCLIENFMDADEEHGPKHPYTHDSLQVIWALATKLKRLAAENETLQGKLRRGNRKPAKPQAEMLKKTPETMPQPQDS